MKKYSKYSFIYISFFHNFVVCIYTSIKFYLNLCIEYETENNINNNLRYLK
jgi:hypothetical protein